jgi:hypothetical protein
VDHTVQLDGYFEAVLVFRRIQPNLNTCKERKEKFRNIRIHDIMYLHSEKLILGRNILQSKIEEKN